MMNPGVARPLSCLLAFLISVPVGLGQEPPIAPKANPPASERIPSRLTIFVLEGAKAINSMPLMRSVTPIVEVRDENEFPVEGATVVFTLPEKGPGGRFPSNSVSFTTRADARGQAAAPFTVNNDAGKFQITVNATSGNRKGEVSITQTNTTGSFVGVADKPRPWYTKKKNLIIIGVVGAGAIGAAIALTRGSSSGGTVIFSPGGPTIGGPR